MKTIRRRPKHKVLVCNFKGEILGEFDSQTECAEALCTSQGRISQLIAQKNSKKTFKGMIICKKEDYQSPEQICAMYLSHRRVYELDRYTGEILCIHDTIGSVARKWNLTKEAISTLICCGGEKGDFIYVKEQDYDPGIDYSGIARKRVKTEVGRHRKQPIMLVKDGDAVQFKTYKDIADYFGVRRQFIHWIANKGCGEYKGYKIMRKDDYMEQYLQNKDIETDICEKSKVSC